VEQIQAGQPCARCGSIIRYAYADAGDLDDHPHLACDCADGPAVSPTNKETRTQRTP
jgi:hypothetical protein